MIERKRFISLAMVLIVMIVAAFTLVDWSLAKQGRTLELTQEIPQREYE